MLRAVFRPRTGPLVVVLALLLLLPSSALAVRSGSVDDPRDIQLSLTPPNMPDVQQVAVSYDEAGSVTATITFWEDTRTRPTSWYGTEVQFIVGARNAVTSACDYILAPEKHYFAAHVGLGSSTTPYGSGSLAGFEGKLSPTSSSLSADGRTVTVTYSNPNLANRNYECVSPLATTWVYSTASNLYSNYGIGCDCWYVASSELGDSLQDFWFVGFKPAPPPAPPPPAPKPVPACSNGEDDDDDGWVDLEDPGCKGYKTRGSEADRYPVRARFALKAKANRCEVETEVEVLPDMRPASRFPFGRVRIRVRGPRYDKVRYIQLGTSDLYGFSVRRSGTYRVSGFYPGDEWRTRSPARRKLVRVRCP